MKEKPVHPPVRCPVKGCGGVMFNISSRLAMGMGVMQVKCDKCGKVIAAKIEKE